METPPIVLNTDFIQEDVIQEEDEVGEDFDYTKLLLFINSAKSSHLIYLEKNRT